MRTFDEALPITREEAEAELASGKSERMCRALVRATLSAEDLGWAEEKCIQLARDQSLEVRGAALTCLGHIARIRRSVDLSRVRPILEEASQDPDLAGMVEDVWDDIEMFAGGKE